MCSVSPAFTLNDGFTGQVGAAEAGAATASERASAPASAAKRETDIRRRYVAAGTRRHRISVEFGATVAPAVARLASRVMSPPAVTVIVATYNRADVLRLALECLSE